MIGLFTDLTPSTLRAMPSAMLFSVSLFVARLA